MMKFSHDIFSEVNPAFCSYALVKFAAAFISVNKLGPELPVLYIALPIALSGDLVRSFAGTNKNTGLLEWLERNPQVQIELANRLNGSMAIVTDALRFACFMHLLKIDVKARVYIGEKKVKASSTRSLSDETAKVIKHAERLGYWFAAAGSTKTIFDRMGLIV